MADDVETLRREKEALEARIRALEAAAAASAAASAAPPPAPAPAPAGFPVVVEPPGPPRAPGSPSAPPFANPFAAARTAVAPDAESFYERLCRLVPESAHGANNSMYKHLRTIFGNIVKQPTEKRYRRLRVDNAKLQSEFFSNPAAQAVLEAVGFEWEHADPAQLNQSDSLVFQRRDEATLGEALTAVERLAARDAALAEEQRKFGGFRRSVGVEIRMEQLQCAAAKGDDHADAFVAAQLLKNDDVNGAELVKRLRTIIGNVAATPDDARFRKLRFSNATLAKEVFPAHGSVEVLVGIAGFGFADDGLVLADPAAAGGDEDAPAASGRDAEAARLQRAARLLEHSEAAIAGRAQTTREAQRAEILRLRRAEEAAMRKELGADPKAPPAAPASAAAAPPASAGGGRRIPIAQALEILLGRDKE